MSVIAEFHEPGDDVQLVLPLVYESHELEQLLGESSGATIAPHAPKLLQDRGKSAETHPHT